MTRSENAVFAKMHKTALAWLCACVLLVCGVGPTLIAQDAGSDTDETTKTDSLGNKLVPKGSGDPSAGSSLLNPLRPTPKDPVTRNGKPELPEIAIKARIFVKGQEPSVILVVGESTHTLRKGDSFSTISPATNESVSIIVKELNQDGVKLHAASLNRTLNLK